MLTRGILATVPLKIAIAGLVLGPGCSDTDEDFTPVGQFDDGIFEITGVPMGGTLPISLGKIYAHTRDKNGTLLPYNASYEIWAVDGTYCTSDRSCSYTNVTFTHKGTSSYEDWKPTALNGVNNARVFRTTYASTSGSNMGCNSKTCTFTGGTTGGTTLSMFPVGISRRNGMVALPIISVQNNNGKISETWFMDDFLSASNAAEGMAFTLPVGGATGTSIDCAVCSAKIKVDVTYQECKSLPATTETMDCN